MLVPARRAWMPTTRPSTLRNRSFDGQFRTWSAASCSALKCTHGPPSSARCDIDTRSSHSVGKVRKACCIKDHLSTSRVDGWLPLPGRSTTILGRLSKNAVPCSFWRRACSSEMQASGAFWSRLSGSRSTWTTSKSASRLPAAIDVDVTMVDGGLAVVSATLGRRHMVSSSGVFEYRLRCANSVLTTVWDLTCSGSTYPLILLLEYMKAASGPNSSAFRTIGSLGRRGLFHQNRYIKKAQSLEAG